MADPGSTVEISETQLEEFNQAIAAYDARTHEWIMHAMRNGYITVNAEGYLCSGPIKLDTKVGSFRGY